MCLKQGNDCTSGKNRKARLRLQRAYRAPASKAAGINARGLSVSLFLSNTLLKFIVKL